MTKITKGMLTSNTDNWATPIDLYNMLDSEFKFNLDPADHENHKCDRYYTKEMDGLAIEWMKDDRIFMNPPYGKDIKNWTKKAKESNKKNGALIVGLLPARTDTKWWKDCMEATEIRFIEGRIKFGNSKNSAPFPSVIVIWGSPGDLVVKSVKVVK